MRRVKFKESFDLYEMALAVGCNTMTDFDVVFLLRDVIKKQSCWHFSQVARQMKTWPQRVQA